ncbi:histidine phosphatase family protein, partial [Streptomyces sp. SolWspMP-sol7th]|uniref:histidine phosphatase family protein n=1 Tax=Streptomyces sp. SolWspMP-sol7th TaxID=1839776 RepID=UPI0034A0C6A5
MRVRPPGAHNAQGDAKVPHRRITRASPPPRPLSGGGLESLREGLPGVAGVLAVPVGVLRREHDPVAAMGVDDRAPVDAVHPRAAVGVRELPVGGLPAPVVDALDRDAVVVRADHAPLLALPVGHGVALRRRGRADEESLPGGSGESHPGGTGGDALPPVGQSYGEAAGVPVGRGVERSAARVLALVLVLVLFLAVALVVLPVLLLALVLAVVALLRGRGLSGGGRGLRALVLAAVAVGAGGARRGGRGAGGGLRALLVLVAAVVGDEEHDGRDHGQDDDSGDDGEGAARDDVGDVEAREAGRAQAAAVATYLRGTPVDAVVSSPLRR